MAAVRQVDVTDGVFVCFLLRPRLADLLPPPLPLHVFVLSSPHLRCPVRRPTVIMFLLVYILVSLFLPC